MADGSIFLPGSPYGAQAATSDMTAERLNAMFDAAIGATAEPQVSPQAMAVPYYSPSQNKFYVGGFEFAGDDEASAVESLKYVDTPADAPQGDWQPLDKASYLGFVQQITDPSLGRSLARGFSRGVDQWQQTAGYGLKFLGADTLGDKIISQQEEDLRKTSPYETQFTDTTLAGGDKPILNWIAYNIATQGMNAIESVVAAAAGAAAGAAVGGPAGALAGGTGAVLSIFGRPAVKQAALTAAKKYVAGEAIDAGERKLLREVAGLTAAAQENIRKGVIFGNIPAAQFAAKTGADRALKAGLSQAKIGGAALGAGLSEYRMGVGEAYAEGDDRALAAIAAVPYAALGFLPEFLAGARIFGLLGGKTADPVKFAEIAGVRKKAAELAKRGGAGAAIGGPLEGFSEAGQEALLIGLNPDVDIDSPEGISRLINSFAAGAAIGGPVGAVANLADQKKPVNILQPQETPEVAPAATGPAEPPASPLEGEIIPPYGPPPPGGMPQLGAPPAPSDTTVRFTAPQIEAQPAPQPQAPMVAGQAAAPQIGLAPPPQLQIPQGTTIFAPGPVAPPPRVPPTQPQADMAAGQLAAQQNPASPDYRAPIAAPAPPDVQQQMRVQQATNILAQNAARDTAANLNAIFEGATTKPAKGPRKPAKGAAPTPAPAPAPATEAVVTTIDPKTVGKPNSVKAKLAKWFNSQPDTVRAYVLEARGQSAEQLGEQIRATNAPLELRKELEDAVRQSEAAQVDVREQAGDGSPVGEGDTQGQEAAGKRKLTQKAAGKSVDKQGMGPKEKAKKDTVVRKGKGAKTQPSPLADEAAKAAAETEAKRKAEAAKAAQEAEAKRVAEEAAAREAAQTVAAPQNELEELGGLIEGYENAATEIDGAMALAAIIDESTQGVDAAKAAAKSYLEGVDKTSIEYQVADAYRKRLDRDREAAVKYMHTLLDPIILVDTINDVNAGRPFSSTLRTQAVQAWSRLKKAGIDPAYGDGKLSDYIVGGSAFFNFKDGKITSTKVGAFSLNDWNTVTGAKNLDGTDVKPMPTVVLKAAVGKFISRLKIKPKVFVYKDQADLKARNKSLYDKARAATKQDFDAANAAAYTFDNDTIIIFSDRIANKAHLQFVLAHETFGHFGLRSLMPTTKFRSLMEQLYRSGSLGMRNAIDMAMEVRGLSLHEATEEYIADYAGRLDTSLVMRVFNAIQNLLNRLGIKYADDTVRLFINQSRRYVRTGTTSSFFDAERIARRLQGIELGVGDTGRFSMTGNVVTDNEKLGALRTGYGMTMALKDFASPTEVWNTAKAAGLDSLDSWDSFKSAALSLANYRALDNPGLTAFDTLIAEMRDESMRLKVGMNEALRSVFNRTLVVGGKELKLSRNAMTRAEEKDLSDVMYDGRAYLAGRLKSMSSLGNEALYSYVDGELVANEKEIARLMDMGTLSLKQIQQGYKIEVELDGVTQTIDIAGKPNITEDSNVWRNYKTLRNAMAEIELLRLRARFIDSTADTDIAYKEIAELTTDREVKATDKAFFNNVKETFKGFFTANMQVDDRGYTVLDSKSMDTAMKFLELTNKAVIQSNKEFDDIGALRAFAAEQGLTPQAIDKLVSQIDKFRERLNKTEANKFNLQNKVKDIVVKDLSYSDEQKYIKRSIATGYVPIIRQGNFQVKVEAFDANGKALAIHEEFRDRLVYSMFDSRSDAEAFTNLLNKEYGETLYEASVFDQAAGEYVKKKIKLKATYEDAVSEVASGSDLNLNEFIRGLEQFGINLNPAKYQSVVTQLTRQNDAARKRLEASFTPGYDRELMLTAVSQHIERQASTIAKIRTRGRLRELMNRNLSTSMDLWQANPKLVTAKYRALEAAKASGVEQSIRFAQRELDKALYQFKRTHPDIKDWDGDPAKAPTDAELGRGKGNRYYNEASRTMQFVDGNRNIDESDWGAKPIASSLRTYTSLVQLGGSIAQGVLNVLSLGSNWMPYMASYNSKNGFGGGFSMGAVTAELALAIKHVGNVKSITTAFSDSDVNYNASLFYDKLVEGKTDPDAMTRIGLKVHEAQFIANEIREGVMIPAQSNALVGYARGRKFGMDKFIDYFMSPFNISEQAARRSAGLAAYRMQYARARAAGLSHKEAVANARSFAVQSINLTLGEYSVLNRPPTWRSGIQSFLYMYKIYPTTVIQLFGNLSRNGKLGMLAALWALSGVAGLPFAEDIEDLVDTIAQMLGLPVGKGIRGEMAKVIDSVFPGMSPVVFKGLINEAIGSPADIAGRTSAGDILPGTGILLAGANTAQEVKDIVGPAFSAAIGTLQFGKDLLTAPFSETVTLEKVAREAPVTALRILGDAYAYMQSDAIVDRRGYVVSPEMGAATILTRVLGFYPTAAANQYELIKFSQRMNNYQREITTGFRQAYVTARLRGDTGRVREIVDAVNEWNKANRGTALEIRNFVKNSQRAYKDATMSASQRALKASSKAARGEVERFFELMGATN